MLPRRLLAGERASSGVLGQVRARRRVPPPRRPWAEGGWETSLRAPEPQPGGHVGRASRALRRASNTDTNGSSGRSLKPSSYLLHTYERWLLHTPSAIALPNSNRLLTKRQSRDFRQDHQLPVLAALPQNKQMF